MQIGKDTVPAVVVEGKSTTELEVLLMEKKKNNSLRNGPHSSGPKQIGPQANINSSTCSTTCLETCFSRYLSWMLST